MARITGKNGRIKVGGVTVASIRNWSLEAKVPITVVTAMEDAFRTQLSLIREWTGTIEGVWEQPAGAGTAKVLWDSFDTATTTGGHQSGKITVDLFPDASQTEKWSGDAFADFSLKTPHDGSVDFTATLNGTGALTRTP